jgi:hypothetical protein
MYRSVCDGTEVTNGNTKFYVTGSAFLWKEAACTGHSLHKFTTFTVYCLCRSRVGLRPVGAI